jgi:hypothetical protein
MGGFQINLIDRINRIIKMEYDWLAEQDEEDCVFLPV